MHFGPSQPFMYVRYISARPSNYLDQALTYPSLADYSMGLSPLFEESAKSLWEDPAEKSIWGPLHGAHDELQKGKSIDPLESFFAGKKEFLVKSVREIMGLIYEREHLKDENIRGIDYDECHTKTRLFEIDHWHPGVNPGIDRIRTNIERELLACEREKRMEEVACWRDVCRQKSDLREVMRDLEREVDRQSLISGGM